MLIVIGYKDEQQVEQRSGYHLHLDCLSPVAA
jgi:hypothetical protein